MNNKGQSILSEYVMIFFVVIAAAVAMTVYVQRAFESRIHEARNYMIDSVVNSGACDANCMQAAGGGISHEYEPYYTFVVSNVGQKQAETSTAQAGNAEVIGVVYTKNTNENTQTASTSIQLPPCAAGPNGMQGCP